MSGFGFGNAANTTAGSAFTFGSNKTTTSGFTLGSNTAPTAAGSLFGTTPTFGTPLTGARPITQPATGLFPAPAGQTSGISFGAPANAIAPTTQTTGLSFGATGPATGGLTFGAPNVTSQTGGISFGSPAASVVQTGLSFGGTPVASTVTTGLSFGNTAPVTTQTGFALGIPTTSTSLTFGAPTTSAPSTGLTFGTPNVTTTQAGLSFGTPTTSATAPGFSFGTPSTSAAPLSFQGLSTTTTTTKPLSLSFGTPAAATTTGFSLTTPVTTSQSTGFSLGGIGTSTSGGPLFGSLTKPLLGVPTTGVATGETQVSTTTSTSIGLGGVDASQTKTGLVGTSPGRPDAKAVKENQIPNEILQTIESFKNFVKSQKGLSSDIARGSIKPLHKVQEDTESLKQMLAGLTSGFQRNGALADRLKADTAKCLHHAEMAQRTHETPPGLQYDNVAPLEYFTELVASFERDMQIFRQEIENTEKHILSLSQPMALTPQELSLVMRRLHDSFIALAGRLQTVHNSVEMQKEQYLNLRKYFLKDSTNVFEEQAKKSDTTGVKPVTNIKISPGPTPFSVLGSQHGFGLASTSIGEQKPSFPSGNALGWGGGQQQPAQLSTNFGGGLFTSGGISSSLNTVPSLQPDSGFQLQKPPLGNKRGKRLI